MQSLLSRRDVFKLSAVGAAAMGRAAARPAGEIAVRVTAGTKRFAAAPPLQWRPEGASSAEAIVVDPARTFQEMLGFGAALTDSATYMMDQLAPDARQRLIRRLFGPADLGFNVCRLSIGSSDYATKMYSYDEGDPDPDMLRFSIDQDRKYTIPILKAARAVNPDLFLFASPWSPPGWMKTGGSMLGGSMRKSHFAAYAKYFVKFLEAYAEAGVPIDAVTVQNEVDTDQDGRMPACLWGQEYEREFVSTHLGPALAERKLATKIWILDHNYDLWGRAICELDDPNVNRYVDGVAWHGYGGSPAAMTRVHEAHPEKHAYWTEGGPDINDPEYKTDWTKWSATFAGILRNWARAITGWNMALDEKGNPNIGPFPCGGLVTIDSKTKEITESGQYWAFLHYSHAIRRGARRIESSGNLEGVAHAAFANPGGGAAIVLTNSGAERAVTLRMSGVETAINLPAGSIVTLSTGI
ncbi:MAG: glycoside hydrolase family 30 protein [Acidobacteriota bacterium]